MMSVKLSSELLNKLAKEGVSHNLQNIVPGDCVPVIKLYDYDGCVAELKQTLVAPIFVVVHSVCKLGAWVVLPKEKWNQLVSSCGNNLTNHAFITADSFTKDL